MLLKIDSHGDELVARELLGMSGRVVDVEPVMPVLLGQVRAGSKRQFDTEGRSGSGGWAPLADSTIARKGHDRILRDRDELYEALTGETGDSVAVTLPDGFDWGTTLVRGFLHQQGTDRMPARPQQLPDRTRRDMVRTLQRFVITGDKIR